MTASNTIAVTPQAPPASGGGGSYNLAVQYRTNDTNSSNNAAAPHFNITNDGSSAVDLSTLKLRYYFTQDNATPFSFWCDWAQIGSGNVQASFVPMSHPTAAADTYLEISFKPGSGSIPAGGSSGPIQTRFSKNDWSNFNEANDYSFDAAKTNFANSSKITLYVNDTLVWGVEPI
ncbi:cellulose binding domain-containing protein [Paenibacillus xylaniclasticus]|uniref:cellulose binding domain-containing protein n=1 Tax=Paenibacillus xylaniclasticus TaxID=588083 RepID=UPI001FEC1624|nr:MULTISPECIES: cellulose binding domain-containing protein [Paenibacillus]